MIIHNPTDSPVIDYPIQDPQTREVNLWSIKNGETLDFPDYVATYLTDVYGFLQRVMTEEDLRKEQEVKKKRAENTQFNQVKIVGEPESAVSIPVVTPDPVGGATEERASTDPTPYIVKCADANCTEQFDDTASMKTHFFDTHINFSGQ